MTTQVSTGVSFCPVSRNTTAPSTIRAAFSVRVHVNRPPAGGSRAGTRFCRIHSYGYDELVPLRKYSSPRPAALHRRTVPLARLIRTYLNQKQAATNSSPGQGVPLCRATPSHQ
jgi:hypothetical protein